MREQRFHIYLDSHEGTILLHSLVELKNQLLAQGRYGKRCSGSIPYGYNRIPGDRQTLVVDPEAAEEQLAAEKLARQREKEKARRERRKVRKRLSPQKCTRMGVVLSL